MPNSNKYFDEVNDAITQDIIKELRLQGHSLTGALEQSFKPYELDESGAMVLTAAAKEYIERLENGLQPNQIDQSITGINEMTRYVELRMGYRGKEAVRVALLILKKQAKEGMPTKSSYQYSKTGERTGAIEETFYKNRERYNGLLDKAVASSFTDEHKILKSGTI